MTANYESLKSIVEECKGTLIAAAKTIRSLIVQRNDALAAANPTDVVAATEQRVKATEAADLQAALEQARLDTQAAIGEAGATPVIVPKPKAPTGPYTKTLSDGTDRKRPNVTVRNIQEENAARADGFTILV